VVRWKSWHRRSTLCLLAYIYLAVTAAADHVTSTGTTPGPELIPLTIPELLRLLRGPVIPQPRRRDTMIMSRVRRIESRAPRDGKRRVAGKRVVPFGPRAPQVSGAAPGLVELGVAAGAAEPGLRAKCRPRGI
jgi:hypothetical protein